MSTLRQQIQKIINNANGDSSAAAFEVCKFLEDEIGLAGNGWFDDDKELCEVFGLTYDD